VTDDVHESWATFLTAQGFEIDNQLDAQRACAPPRSVAPDTPTLIDLNHFTSLRLAGPDARTFLQGYLTCDLEQLDDGRALCGALCNIKGRVVADVLVLLWEDQPTLLLHASLRDVVTASLAKYLAFSRSRFDSPDRAPILLGLIDPQPHGAQPLDVTLYRGGRAIAVPGAAPRDVLVLSDDDAQVVWRDYAARDAVGDAGRWDLIDVTSSIAHVYAATSERFLPQMLGFDALGYVSFTKGCYLGQEIVARTQHLGRPKRALQRLHWQGELPQVGGELRGGDRSGTLVGVAAIDERAGEALAVLSDGTATALSATGTTFDVIPADAAAAG